MPIFNVIAVVVLPDKDDRPTSSALLEHMIRTNVLKTPIGIATLIIQNPTAAQVSDHKAIYRKAGY